MEKIAADTLNAGGSVVVDATFTHAGSRKRIEEIARQCGADFTGIWLDAPQPVLEKRVTDRTNDPSDATAAVVRRQLSAKWGRIDWPRLDAGVGPAAVLEKARAILD